MSTASEEDIKKGDFEDSNVTNYPSRLAEDFEDSEALTKAKKTSSFFTVALSATALTAEGANAQLPGYTNIIFKYLYGSAFTKVLKTRLSLAYFVGMIVGQLGFGFASDRFGRKASVFATAFLFTLGIIIATSASGATVEGLIWMAIVGRGISGVGAGGFYPVCSISSAEASDESVAIRKNRGFIVGMIGDFAIDLGFVLAGVVVLIVLAAYGATGSGDNQIAHLSEGIWRISFGVIIIPAFFIFYGQFKMINSTAFRKSASKSTAIPWVLTIKRYWPRMIGTCLCWFLYDFISYPFGLFSSTIIDQLSDENTIIQAIGYGTLINFFYLPGAFAGAVLMDRIGRKNTQLYSFLCQAIFGFILGGALGPIQSVFPLFIVMYGLFLSLGEAVGSTTLLISSEVYPTSVRGKLFGLSAAFGKAGAAIGTQVFTPIQDSFPDVFKGQQAVFLIGSGVALAGAVVTYFLIPEMDRDLGVEDAEFKAYLEANGWDTSDMGESLESSATKTLKAELKL